MVKQIGKSCDVRDKIESFLDSSLTKAVNIWGNVNSNRDNSQKDEILDIVIDVLNRIEAVYDRYPNLVGDIFNWEFKTFLIKLPLFAILDIFCLLGYKCGITAEDFMRYQSLINKARELEFRNDFRGVAHINPEFIENMGEDFKYEVRGPIKSAYYDNDGIHNYNSTILTYNEVFNGAGILTSDDENNLNNNVEKYPALACKDIILVNFLGSNGHNVPFSHAVALFLEDKDYLSTCYNALISEIEEERTLYFFNNINSLYGKNGLDLESFTLSEEIDWDSSDELHTLRYFLELIYKKALEIKHGDFNKQKVFSGVSFWKYFGTIENTLNLLIVASKKRVIDSLVDIYNSSSNMLKAIYKVKNIDDVTLRQRLNRLSLVELYGCLNKVKANSLGYKYFASCIR